LEEALEFYKKVLEINPDDEDAKYNIEFVQKKIKEMMDRAAQRQQNQQDNQEQNVQSEQQEEGEEQQKQEREGGDDRREPSQMDQNDSREEAEEKAEDSDEETEGENEPPPSMASSSDSTKVQHVMNDGEKQQDGMTLEDAERLLNALADEEKEVRLQIPHNGDARVDKDW
jgi:TolA-binding protein